jgi:hypothetical protein
MKKFDNMPDKNPFRVPESYFEEVNRKMIAAAAGNSHDDVRRLLFHRLKPYLLAAAAITGFVLLSYSGIRLLTPHKVNPPESEAAIEEYFSPYINDLDIYSLEENVTSLVVPEQNNDVSNAEIIEYLVFENIEVSEIYEQL